MRHSLALSLLLALPWGPLAAQQDKPADAGVISIDAAGFDANAARFYTSGRTSLPDGTMLYATVLFSSMAVQPVRTKVEKGAFKVDFEPLGKKMVLAGSYHIQVEARAEDQAAEAQLPPNNAVLKEVQVGTPEKQAEQVATMKKQLLGVTENCRQLFLRAEDNGSYILLGIARRKERKEGLTAADKKRYLDAWKEFADPGRWWISTYDRVVMGYNDYHDAIYVSYFPQVEQDVAAVLATLEKWFFSYWSDICAALDQEIPQEIKERGQFFDRGSVEQALAASVNRIYGSLQVPEVNWHPVTLWDSEDGTIVRNTYTSKTTLFEVSRPDDQWDFEVLTADPVVRLKIKPHDPIRQAKGFATVEVKDFPDSKGPEDLRDLVEMIAHERYPSYQKVSGKSIAVPDPNFPGGNRPGVDLLFLYQQNNVNWKVRSYELFCGTYKRTYAVVCVAYAEEWKSYENEFETMCKGFKVLKQIAPEGDKK